ncbi:hypothetical protein, partial [Chromobacterium haemolyticum]|uniref:hypothetical protein n=1 Tax=Chromobacterium haemolyticum TaxID=394935 RepID=UPI00307D9047
DGWMPLPWGGLVGALMTSMLYALFLAIPVIDPRQKNWEGFAERDATRTLGWISVHCGPTEKNHFFHAMNAIRHYARAMALDLERYSLDGIVGAYLEQKAAVLETVALDVAAEAL